MEGIGLQKIMTKVSGSDVWAQHTVAIYSIYILSELCRKRLGYIVVKGALRKRDKTPDICCYTKSDFSSLIIKQCERQLHILLSFIIKFLIFIPQRLII